ncbi:hypothetical protein NMY22_g19767 [Coprinellus aureogranulatus]|nr:hypothetical protein NMY22_g19767 [Coprinellus aureogranulatus]
MEEEQPRKAPVPAASTRRLTGRERLEEQRRARAAQKAKEEEEAAAMQEDGRGDVRNIFDDEEEGVEVYDEPQQNVTIELVDEDEEMVDDWAGIEYDDIDEDGLLSSSDEDQHHHDNNYEYAEEGDSREGLEAHLHPTSSDADCFALDETYELSTLQAKPLDEQTEIAAEISDFKRALPQLGLGYHLVDRLGTGTFSSVYKAIDLLYHEYDNTPWLGHHPPESSAHYQSLPYTKKTKEHEEGLEGRKGKGAGGGKVFVAIKRIYVTSGPERIKNELQIMADCRGCRHVSQLITAFRHHDQVAIVMPYHRNEDFRVRLIHSLSSFLLSLPARRTDERIWQEYFMDLPMPAIKEYMRCLLRALRDVHTRRIIHRDVKPANFLFDPRTGLGSLCDFGLAQKFDSKPPGYGACLHSTMEEGAPHGRYLEEEYV